MILSKKHGLAPALSICPICREDAGVVLLGNQADRIPDFDFGRTKVIGAPCERCQGSLNSGAVAILSEDMNNVIMLTREGAERAMENPPYGKVIRVDKGTFAQLVAKIPPELLDKDNRPEKP